MSSTVTIISKGVAFMTDALAKNLQQAGLKTNVIPPDMKVLDSRRTESDVFLVYAGEYVSGMVDFFVYLKDICTEDEKKICIIGYSTEIADVKSIVTDMLVALEFLRPFDMKTLVFNMVELCAADEEWKKAKHILLIDDDLTYLKTVQGWLSKKYRVTIARSGMQAITYMASHIPDLILLDYDMPVTAGPLVMEMIRSQPNSRNVPIIFLTGKADKESVMSVMALKPQGYLLKTLTKEQILETVDNFFATNSWNIYLR